MVCGRTPASKATCQDRAGQLPVIASLKGSEVSIEPGARVSVRLDTEVELDLGSAPKRR